MRYFFLLVFFFQIVSLSSAHATVVRMVTSLGLIDIQLYDDRAPETVNNFLTYVDRGDYAVSIIHRRVSDFVIQG